MMSALKQSSTPGGQGFYMPNFGQVHAAPIHTTLALKDLKAIYLCVVYS